MFFLLRMAFWVTVILAVLPVFITRDDAQTPGASVKFSTGEAFSAATATMSDLGQFCNRRPEACAVGAQAAAAVGASAQAGAKILYGYLQDKVADDAAAPRNVSARKTIKDKPASDRSAGTASITPSQDTLLPVDLAPTWRGPGSKHPA